MESKDNHSLDQNQSAFVSAMQSMVEILNGHVKESWLNRKKIGTQCTLLEQEESGDLHAVQLAEGWVTSKPPKDMTFENADPLHRINCQIFQEVI